ncbi:MAG: hypothetical protein E2O96_04935 [Acidobacteria bacterium]|nr:MAG: hypothetical protein E2O96_04935 [Acidobacteriota bacterium]
MPTVPVPGPDGLWPVPVEDLTPRELSTLGSYFNAVQTVLANRHPLAATEFDGVTIAGIRLPTDPDEIERLAFEGEFDIDEFYTFDRGEP